VTTTHWNRIQLPTASEDLLATWKTTASSIPGILAVSDLNEAAVLYKAAVDAGAAPTQARPVYIDANGVLYRMYGPVDQKTGRPVFQMVNQPRVTGSVAGNWVVGSQGSVPASFTPSEVIGRWTGFIAASGSRSYTPVIAFPQAFPTDCITVSVSFFYGTGNADLNTWTPDKWQIDHLKREGFRLMIPDYTTPRIISFGYVAHGY